MSDDLHRQVLEAIDRACDRLGLDDGMRRVLREAERSVTVTVPFVDDAGEVRVVTGHRIAHSTARGPAKGGLRFHPDVTPSEVAGLAALMSIKTAVMDLPLGGGKGGVPVDPRQLSAGEIEALTRGFARAIVPVIGPHVDVPAPDVNTGAQHMDWIADEYARVHGERVAAVVTGKSLEAGGSHGRDTATASGCRIVLHEAVERLELDAAPRVVVQGFGNAGSHLARILALDGWRIVGVSDSSGGLHDPDGLDIEAVIRTKRDEGAVTAHPDGDTVDGDELLTLDCDVLVPAALEGAIDASVAERLQARLIAEAANAPVDLEADEILADRGLVVIPDVLASAGGVTVSCFEWEQNLAGQRWSAEEVAQRLTVKMSSASASVWKTAEERSLTLRDAAVLLGVERIAAAERRRMYRS